MNSFRLNILYLTLFLFLTMGMGSAAQLFAQDTALEAPPAGQKIAALLEQLESDRYEERHAASARLAEHGVACLPFLVERMLTGPPETAACCGRLLSRIAMRSEQQDMTRVARIFLLLSKNGMQHLGQASVQLNARWKQGRLAETISQLSEVGINAEPVGQFFAQSVPVLSGGFLASELDSETDGTKSEGEIPSQTALPLRKTDQEILQAVNQILRSSEKENNDLFVEEMQAAVFQNERETDSTADSFRENNTGAFIVEAWDIETSEQHFSVTIGPDFQGTDKDLKLLRLLPEIAQLTIVEQEIDRGLLELLIEDTTIQYVSLIQCDYELPAIFQVIEKRPDMLLTSAGNEAFLGVQLQTKVDVDGQSFCEVLEVVQGSAAEAAGLRSLDIIESINGTQVDYLEQTILAIGAFKPGDVLTLKIKRQDEELSVAVKLRARAPDP